jgi:hypothetical protein
MKFTLSLVAFLIAISSQATIITVSNTVNVPAMYNNAQVAVDAASDGDTVQVFPSQTYYGSLNITRGITLLGAGLGSSFRSSFNYVNCSTPSDVHIMGLDIAVFGVYSAQPGNNWVIESCQIMNMLFPGVWNNVLVKHCFGLSNLGAFSDDNGIVFSNNIFISGAQATIGEDNGVDNNYNPSATSTFFSNNYFPGTVRFIATNLVFSDNIFKEALNTSNSRCYNCMFQNNYSFCQSCSISNISDASAINNIENGPNPFVNDSIDLSQADFNLLEGSTAIGAGVTGADIGLHAGLYPPSADLNYGLNVVGLPVIDFFTIDNPIIIPNGQLRIQATSTIPAAQ